MEYRESVPKDDRKTSELDTDKKKQIPLYLISSDSDTECRFWIGLAQKGIVAPSNLLDLADLNEVFHQAATQGITEDIPVMLVNSSLQPPTYLYFCEPPSKNASSHWVDKICETVISWKPPEIGIYFAPELMNSDASYKLLAGVIRKFILLTPEVEFHLLLGSHGINLVLNTSLGLKQEMKKIGYDLYVYH